MPCIVVVVNQEAVRINRVVGAIEERCVRLGGDLRSHSRIVVVAANSVIEAAVPAICMDGHSLSGSDSTEKQREYVNFCLWILFVRLRTA